MRGPPPLALLLAFLLLSGCLAASPAPAPSGSPSAPAASTSASASPRPAGTSPPTPPAPPPPPDRTAFAMVGQTDMGACAFTEVGGICRFAGGAGNVRQLAAAGPLLRVSGNLTWPDSALGLTVSLLHRENGTWVNAGDPYAQARQPPLAFDFPLRGRTEALALSVQQLNGAPFIVGFVAAATPQEFRLDGVLEWDRAAT